MKRTIAIGVVAALSALPLAACSSSGSGGGSSSLSLWSSGDGKDGLAKYVKAYTSADKGVVKSREIPFANYDSALNQAFNAKSGPDVVFVNSTSLGTFASKGYLTDISKIVKLTGNLAPDNFYKGFIDQTQWKGKQVALPIDTGSRILQYNKVLFKKAGVAPFGETVSWDEMVTAAQKIHALGSKYQGFCFAGGQNLLAVYEDVGPLVHQAGGDFLDAAATKSTIDSPAGVKAFNTYKALAATGDKSNVVGQDPAVCAEKMGAGTVGMQIAGFWNIPSKEQTTGKFELGQSLPKDQSVYSSTGGWTLAVPSYVPASKYPAIKKFITDLYKPKSIIQATGLMPATVNGRKANTTLTGSRYDLYWKILAENAGHPIALNPNLSNQATIVMNALQSVLNGKSTESALKKAQHDIDATLG
jgi:multiple sugar transport system substrate-binding protein